MTSLLAGLAATATPFLTAPARGEDEPSKIHAVMNVEFANEYVTPRGMIVADQGLTIQPLLLGLVNLYKGDGFINDLTLTPGVWFDLNTRGVSIHAPYDSRPFTSWVETDPILGMSVGFAKHFTYSLTYTAFAMQVLDIGTSQHLENKLAFDDSEYLHDFALHPSIIYWQELVAKATDADVPQAVLGSRMYSGNHPQPGSSYYFDIGIDPQHTFKDFGGLKLEAPMRVLLPDERFYGDYYGKSSAVGLFELGVKATLPMSWVPKGYGHWSCHAGFKYLYFVDDNLYNLNAFNSPGKPTRDTWQGFVGLNTFF